MPPWTYMYRTDLSQTVHGRSRRQNDGPVHGAVGIAAHDAERLGGARGGSGLRAPEPALRSSRPWVWLQRRRKGWCRRFPCAARTQ